MSFHSLFALLYLILVLRNVTFRMEDFFKFCGLLRVSELYLILIAKYQINHGIVSSPQRYKLRTWFVRQIVTETLCKIKKIRYHILVKLILIRSIKPIVEDFCLRKVNFIQLLWVLICQILTMGWAWSNRMYIFLHISRYN